MQEGLGSGGKPPNFQGKRQLHIAGCFRAVALVVCFLFLLELILRGTLSRTNSAASVRIYLATCLCHGNNVLFVLMRFPPACSGPQFLFPSSCSQVPFTVNKSIGGALEL